MAVVAESVRPHRGVGWLWSESTPLALTIATIGTAAVVVVLLGGFLALLAQGMVPVKSLITGLTSTSFQACLVLGVVLGAVGIVAGLLTYRRMPTKVSREEAVGGAIAGAQGLVLGVGLLIFTQGNIETFARNFLDFKLVFPQIDAFFTGAKNTLFLAFAGELLGIVLGLLLAVFAISNRPVVRAPARVYINFFRGTPLIWQLSIIYFGLLATNVSLTTYTAAILAFSLNTGAYSAEVFRAGIQSVERGQLEAARGLGMSYFQAMRYSIIPQAIRRVIPPLMNEFVILIKDTSLVVFLGLTASQRELFSVGQQGYSNSFNATFFVATGLGYLVVTLPLIRVVNAVEKRLRSGLVGVAG